MKSRILGFFVVFCSFVLPLSAQEPPDQSWQMRFDGSTAVVLPVSPALDIGATYTFQLWVYPERRTSGAVLIRKGLPDVDSDPFFAFQLRLDASGQPGWGQSRGAPGSQMSSVSATPLPLNVWSHLAVTCNGSVMILYLNGVEIKRQSSPGGPPPVNDQPIHLGTQVNPSNARFPGLQSAGFAGILRQFNIWNRALTPAEIRASMTATPSGAESGLIGYWPLDDGPGYTFRDAGPNQLSATLRYPTPTKLMNGATPMNEQYQPDWQWTAFWNSNPFIWSFQPQTSLETNMAVLYPIDFDSDGDLDLLGSGIYEPAKPEAVLKAYRNDGNGNFQEATSAVLGSSPLVVRGARRGIVADVNHDGRADLVIGDSGSDIFCCDFGLGQNRVLIQTADGRLVDETSSRIPIRARFSHDNDGADIDGDGNIDLVFDDINGPLDPAIFYVNLMMNDGSGHFSMASASRLPQSLAGKKAGFVRFLDANHDGYPDLFLGFGEATNLDRDLLLLNDGKGRFLDMAPATLPPRVGGANCATLTGAVGDLNGDGWPDILLSIVCDRYTQGAFQVLINSGHGTFTDATAQWLPESLILQGLVARDAFVYSDEIRLVDFNSDGRLDVLARVPNGGTQLYLNNGTQLVNTSAFLPNLETIPPPTAVADFDRDGRTDIVFGDQSGNSYNTLVVGLNKRSFPAPAAISTRDPSAPVVLPLMILNDASQSADALAPGSRVRIRGVNLGPVTPVKFPEAPGATPPATLGGVTVTFGSTSARLISVSSTEIVALVPFSLAGQWLSQVRVSYDGRVSNPIPVLIHDANPQIYSTLTADPSAGFSAGYFIADAWKISGQSRTKITTPGQLQWGDRVAFRLTGAGQAVTPLSDENAAQPQPFSPATPLPVALGVEGNGVLLTPVSVTYAPDGLSGIVEVTVDLPAAQPPNAWWNFYVPSWRYVRNVLWPYNGSPDNLTFQIPDHSGLSRRSSSDSSSVQVGFGRIVPNALNTAPSGMAIFSYTKNGVLVTEAAVPASPLIQGGRIFAEIAGRVDTGIAIANPNSQIATITFYYTDAAGVNVLSGTTTIPANGQIAAFLDQAPFISQTPPDLSLVRSFTFTSSIPVGVTALRGYTNERDEFLITTLPVSPVGANSAGTFAFPHYADGGGWTSAVVLVNPTDSTISGTVQFYSKGAVSGAGATVTLTANGISANSFSYTIPARSAFKLQTSGGGSVTQSGWVNVTPNSASAAPSGLVVFSFQTNGVRISEAGVPALPASSAFRMYAEAAGDFDGGRPGAIQTGIAISNPSSTNVTVRFELSNLDGTSTGLSGTMTVPATGQIATFLNQIPGMTAIPASFKGILRVSGANVFVTGLRGRYNERGDFLITTTAPVSENNIPSSAELVFPQLADGGGYSTQVILFSGAAGQSTSGFVRFMSQSGQPLTVRLQ